MLAALYSGARPPREGANSGLDVTTSGEDEEKGLVCYDRPDRPPRRLARACWPAHTPALAVSRAGWPDELASDHTIATLGGAALLHAGRPTVVTVGVGAMPVVPTVPAAARAARAAGAVPTAPEAALPADGMRVRPRP